MPPKSSSRPPRASQTLTPHEALIYVMIMASAVDRVMSDVEMQSIGLIVKRLPAFENFDSDKLVGIARECGRQPAQDRGFDTVLGRIEKALSSELHETAYAFAVEVAAVDKTVNLEEVRLLERLADRFELDDLITAAIKRSAEARYRSL